MYNTKVLISTVCLSVCVTAVPLAKHDIIALAIVAIRTKMATKCTVNAQYPRQRSDAALL